VLRAVRQADADIGMSNYWQAQPGLEFRPIAGHWFVLVCPANHRLAQRNQVTWSVLKNESFLMLTPDTSMRRLLDDTFGDFSTIVQPASKWAPGHALRLARAGLGITALPISRCRWWIAHPGAGAAGGAGDQAGHRHRHPHRLGDDGSGAGLPQCARQRARAIFAPAARRQKQRA
jgi:DNA-binding transcriptional LysR family regulator